MASRQAAGRASAGQPIACSAAGSIEAGMGGSMHAPILCAWRSRGTAMAANALGWPFPPQPAFPMPASSLKTRERLSEVRYEIRGELARRARELEADGRSLVKLNIGNPGAFGFRAPEHLQRAIADGIASTDPYTHQQGLPAAREAIAAFHRARGTPNASPERVFVGNGVS